MIVDTNEFNDFLCKAKISPNQFWIAWLIHHKDVKNAIKYMNEIGNKFDAKDILELVDKGFLVRVREDKELQLDDFLTTPKFTNLVIVDLEEIGKQLWDIYPKWLWLQGRKVPAKSCDKEELIAKYSKKIKNNKKKHLNIIKLIEQYKQDNEYAEMGIEKFVGSEHWDNLEDLNSASNKIDTTRDI